VERRSDRTTTLWRGGDPDLVVTAPGPSCAFAIVSNCAGSGQLLERSQRPDWADIRHLQWVGGHGHEVASEVRPHAPTVTRICRRQPERLLQRQIGSFSSRVSRQRSLASPLREGHALGKYRAAQKNGTPVLTILEFTLVRQLSVDLCPVSVEPPKRPETSRVLPERIPSPALLCPHISRICLK
jgi:hypothetical protein